MYQETIGILYFFDKADPAFWVENHADIQKIKLNFERKYPPFDYIRQVYDSLANYCSIGVGEGEGISADYDLMDFCKKFKLSPLEAMNSVKILEEEGFILTSDPEETQSKVQILVNRTELYRYQVSNSNLDSFVKFLLRNYTGLFNELTYVNEVEMARKANCAPEVISNYLSYLQKMDLILYHPAKQTPVVVFLQDRKEKDSLRLNEKRILERKARQQVRLEAMIKYVTNKNHCRSVLLLEYFGEKAVARCGNCDACLSRNEIDVNALTFDYIVEDLKKMLRAEALSISDVIAKLPQHSEREVREVIKYLLDKEKIVYASGARLQWNS